MVTSKDKKKEPFGFCSHHRRGHRDFFEHTFRISVRGRDYYFCARCTGIYSSFFSFLLVGIILGYSVIQNRIDGYVSLLLSIILVLPLLIDWGTQKLRLRESTNPLRFITGFIFGIGFWFVQFTILIFFWELLAIILYSLTMYIITLIGRQRRRLKNVHEIDDDLE